MRTEVIWRRGAACVWLRPLRALALTKWGLVLTHAMAHPLSGRFGVPHGVACALLTPPVMAFNAIAAPERLAEVGHILGVPRNPAKTIYEQAYQAAEAFRALMRQLDLPLTLTELARAVWHGPRSRKPISIH